MKIKIMQDGVLASAVTITQCNGDHEIKYIWTAPKHRGQGLASSLIEKAKAKFPVLVAFLEDDGTGLTVEQMEEWYKRHGFKKRRYDLGQWVYRNYKTVMYWEDQTRGNA